MLHKKNGRESNMYDKFHLHSKGKNNIKNLLAKEMETVWFGLLFFLMALDIHLLMVSFWMFNKKYTNSIWFIFSMKLL